MKQQTFELEAISKILPQESVSFPLVLSGNPDSAFWTSDRSPAPVPLSRIPHLSGIQKTGDSAPERDSKSGTFGSDTDF